VDLNFDWDRLEAVSRFLPHEKRDLSQQPAELEVPSALGPKLREVLLRERALNDSDLFHHIRFSSVAVRLVSPPRR
jgi:hypothetical protein